jgi:hypothetical protein
MPVANCPVLDYRFELLHDTAKRIIHDLQRGSLYGKRWHAWCGGKPQLRDNSCLATNWAVR